MKITLALLILAIIVLAIALNTSLPPSKSDLSSSLCSASQTPSSLHARNLARRHIAESEKLKLKFKRDMTVGQLAGMIFGIVFECLLLGALAVWFTSDISNAS
jgi:hypothetical protein